MPKTTDNRCRKRSPQAIITCIKHLGTCLHLLSYLILKILFYLYHCLECGLAVVLC